MDQDETWHGGRHVCPGHIVLHRDPAPLPKRGTHPSFRPMSIVTKRSPVSATAEPLLVLCGRLCCYASAFGRTKIYPEYYIPASMLLLNVGCFTLAQKLHGDCPHTYTLGSNVITSVEEEQERDLGIGLLFKAVHESLKH